jgi:hypothetical protein
MRCICLAFYPLNSIESKEQWYWCCSTEALRNETFYIELCSSQRLIPVFENTSISVSVRKYHLSYRSQIKTKQPNHFFFHIGQYFQSFNIHHHITSPSSYRCCFEMRIIMYLYIKKVSILLTKQNHTPAAAPIVPNIPI